MFGNGNGKRNFFNLDIKSSLMDSKQKPSENKKKTKKKTEIEIFHLQPFSVWY